MHVVVRLLLISVAWALFQIGSGYLTNRLPERMFRRDGPLYRGRRWERGGETYARLFLIRRWKDRLPEAGAMFQGGFAKRGLRSRSPERLRRFIVETRRAELTHWLPVLLSFSFFAWNPLNVAIWMPVIGLLGNAPFIMVQRYVRPRMQRLLERRAE